MMPFTSDTLIDALVLLLHSENSNVRNMINELVDIYDDNANEEGSDNVYDVYVDIIRYMLKFNITIKDKAQMEVFMLKLRELPTMQNDQETYLKLKTIFTDDTLLSEDQERSLARKVANCILWCKDIRLTRKISATLSRIRLSTVTADFQDKLIGEVNELCSTMIRNNQEAMERFVVKKDETSVPFLDFTDKENLHRALNAYAINNQTNVFKTGWQGLNRALHGGFALGSSIVFNALAYSGKTMMLLKMARWQVSLNNVSSQYRNPTCIIYSLENETPQNLRLLFNEFYVNKFHNEPPVNWTIDQIADFCFDEAAKCGWRLVIDRRLGANFGYAELVSNFEEYLAKGWTPLMVVIDYMNMMKKSNGKQEARNDLQIRELYTNVRNYLTSHHCTLVTAHQLNRQAAEVARVNPTGAVRRFDIGMLSDSTDPQREVDITFYQHKERDLRGRYWMTFKLDKDRYHPNTPDQDKFFAYMFDEKLGILDDIDGPDRSAANINHLADVGSDDEEDSDMSLTSELSLIAG